MFGKESHSREGYEDLEGKYQEAQKASTENPGHTETYPSGGFMEGGMSGDPSKHIFQPSKETERTRELFDKLEKMKNQGHAEALKLEATHNQLIQKAEDARTALDTFEKEQLDMRKEA